MAKPLPMFPLGTVLFPHAVLPLHVFEPRYRALVETCLHSDGRFGVVLIERGYEVGGGDARFASAPLRASSRPHARPTAVTWSRPSAPRGSASRSGSTTIRTRVRRSTCSESP